MALLFGELLDEWYADTFWPMNLTSDHIGGSECERTKGVERVQCVSTGLTYLESYFSYANTLIPESEFPRTIDATPRASQISAGARSIAAHAAPS
jgi:hypothetical protein